MHILMYTHIYSTYIKMHPYVVVEYFKDVMNLVSIVTNGTYGPING